MDVSTTCASTWAMIAALVSTTCDGRSEEHTSELQSQSNLVCRLLLEKKKNKSLQFRRTVPSIILRIQPLSSHARFISATPDSLHCYLTVCSHLLNPHIDFSSDHTVAH